MKKILVPLLVAACGMTLLTGCLDLQLGGGSKTSSTNTGEYPAIGQQMTAPTIGQQLIDLQRAKDSGAITDSEYQGEKARLLGEKIKPAAPGA